jgi:hypothetical protein
LKAIHNKDYSVVKTFGLPLDQNQGAFFLLSNENFNLGMASPKIGDGFPKI